MITDNIFLGTFVSSVTLVRKRTILTERPPLVGEGSAKFCDRGCGVVSALDPHAR
jgi:hypothetical protein